VKIIQKEKLRCFALKFSEPKAPKIVYQYLADKKTFIAKYNSLREMAKQTGITRDYVVEDRSIDRSTPRSIKKNELVHNKWFFTYISDK